jgi:diaminopimelate epimerase
MKYGAAIENHPMFPNRINVQFVRPVHSHEAEMLIWERGAGYTLASGSSSSAVACALVKMGLASSPVTIKMPGGELVIDMDEAYHIRMTGDVARSPRAL